MGRHASEMVSHVRAVGQISENILGVKPVGPHVVDNWDFVTTTKASGGYLTRSTGYLF